MRRAASLMMVILVVRIDIVSQSANQYRQDAFQLNDSGEENGKVLQLSITASGGSTSLVVLFCALAKTYSSLPPRSRSLILHRSAIFLALQVEQGNFRSHCFRQELVPEM